MCKVIESLEVPMWGGEYRQPKGGIASLGSSRYEHRFGGNSWTVSDPNPVAGGPTLLLTLDLRDPLLCGFQTNRTAELPICSYFSCDVWTFPQLYRIEPASRHVVLIERKGPATDVRFPEFAKPFSEKSISINGMSDDDYPTTEDAYWRACDDFLGGGRFIRVLGPPLWLYAASTVTCNCGRAMHYICSMGYETERRFSGLIDNSPVFFGEGAFYWFVCLHCLTVGVMSQPT
jgi:hypothetical protein